MREMAFREAGYGVNGLHGQNGQDGQDGQKTTTEVSIQSMKSIKSILFPQISANAALILIGVASALLNRQIAAQAKAFEQEGGFTERLYRVRTANRKKKP